VPPLAEALARKNYETLTPVQQNVLDPELADSDLLVSAQTGSGKTVAFGIALAPTLMAGEERFSRAERPLALVVAPTRELALQVKRELQWLYELTGASFASCVGGMDMRTERQALGRGAHIVVGTPGRLRDHIERGSLDMTGMRAVVLDEADEMLDLGFREDLEFILGAAPADRRTLMFSATVPKMIVSLAKRFQRDAVRLATTAEQRQHVDIEYRAMKVAPSDRENAIINVLRYFEAKSAIVFCATRESVNRMTSRFTNRGFSVVALSGELSQGQRTHALQAMRDGRARVCIATDVAARGLDLPDLELVIHADLPQNSQALLHRSGRTGRAGRKGVSVLIVPFNQRFKAERLLQGARIEANWGDAPSVAEITERDDQRLLQDETLTEPVAEAEQAFVDQILAQHSPEQIAAAFVRLYRAGQSAPEELQENSRPERGEKRDRQPREKADFTDGTWFSLSVGHKQNAEPRWLLPMLYRTGNIAQGDVGAIRIHGGETHVQIAPGSVDSFTVAIGPNRTIDKNINVTRLEGTPEAPDEQPGRAPERKRPYAGKSAPRKDFGDRGDDSRDRPKPEARTEAREGVRDERHDRAPDRKRPYAGKDKPRKSFGDRGEGRQEGASPDAADRPRAKKSYKPRTPRADGPGDKPRKPFAERREGGPDRPSPDGAAQARPSGKKPFKSRAPGPDGPGDKPRKVKKHRKGSPPPAGARKRKGAE